MDVVGAKVLGLMESKHRIEERAGNLARVSLRENQTGSVLIKRNPRLTVCGRTIKINLCNKTFAPF